jgi:hypothetical protein
MRNRFFMTGANHRLASLLFLALVTWAACMGLPKLRVDTGFKSLISDTDPDKRFHDKIVQEFGSDNRTIVYVRDAKLWTPDKLAALEKLHYALQGLDLVEDVDDLFNLRSIRGKGEEIDSRVFLSEAPKDQATADEARDNALYNPLVLKNFLSGDGTATALLVSLRKDGDDSQSNRRANDALEDILASARPVFQEVFQVGPPRIDAELKDILLKDLTRLGPLSVVALVLAILFILRSGFAAVAPIVTSGLSIVWTFGMMGWADIPLNILSAMLPSLVIVISSTGSLHLIASYFQGIFLAEKDHRAFATRLMMKQMGVPLFLTVLTTAMGFASNIFSGIGIIQDFAMAATFAILANGLITMLLVPMAFSVLGPLRTRLFLDKERVMGIPGVFVKAFGLTNRHFPRSILALTAILCAFFVYQASKLHVTNDPLSYFQADQPLIRDIQRLHQGLPGMKVFFITLESDQNKAFLEPKNIEKLTAIQKFMEKQGIFDGSISIADHLSLVNREFHGGDPKYFTPPNKRDLVAQYLLFFDRRDLKSYASHDFRRANIVVRHNVSDSRTLNRNIRELREVASEIAGVEMKAHVVGEDLMIHAVADGLLVDQAKSLAILLCVIFLMMSVVFTSFKGGLVSLIPNLIPIILIFGVMGILRIPLNPGAAMVAVIAIGIAIDGTIHLFSRYNDLCRRTADYESAVHRAVSEEATPMVSTNLALALGFGILLQSHFTVIAQFGALSAATMLFALFSNLLITPIIMGRIRLVGLYQILAMDMDKEVLERSPLFQGMTNYQMRKAILISKLHKFKEGELLVEQGTLGRSMYLILSGQVEVVRRDEGGGKRLAALEAGQVFGEVGYIRETRRTADVRALSPVRMLSFDYEKMRKDLRFFPYIAAKLNFNISSILGERLADVMESLKSKPDENEP